MKICFFCIFYAGDNEYVKLCMYTDIYFIDKLNLILFIPQLVILSPMNIIRKQQKQFHQIVAIRL